MAFKMKHTKGGFPFKKSPMKDNHSRWARIKNKVGEYADKAEGYIEKATYVPGFIGQAASTLDGLKDSYDAYTAYKSGDMDTYKKEMVDVGLNAFNVATGGTSKLMTTAAKKGLKEGTKYLAKEGVEKFAQAKAKKGYTDFAKDKLTS